MEKLGITEYYLGTHSKDEIAKLKLPRDHFMIINLQDSDAGSGTHWVCLYSGDEVLEYVDSYGVPPPEEVRTVSWKNKRRLLYQTDQWQDFVENTCGWYCLAYAWKRLQGTDPGMIEIRTRDVNTLRKIVNKK